MRFVDIALRHVHEPGPLGQTATSWVPFTIYLGGRGFMSEIAQQAMSSHSCMQGPKPSTAWC